MIKLLFTILIFLISALVFGQDIQSYSFNCIFPEPDGGNANVASQANIHGKITRVTHSMIIVSDKFTHQETIINYNKKTQFYTVFGGDGPLSKLKVGLESWVWFVNCKKPIKKTPIAKMIFVFSIDPNDVNPDWNNDYDKNDKFPWLDDHGKR